MVKKNRNTIKKNNSHKKKSSANKNNSNVDKKKTDSNKSSIKTKKQKSSCCLLNIKNEPWKISVFILAVVLLLSFLTNGFGTWNNDKVSDDTKDSNKDTIVLNAYFVNDIRCDQCQGQEQQLVANLKQLFPDMNVINIEYTSEEGEKFYNKHDLRYLPAVLFTENIELEGNYNQVSQYLRKSENLLVLSISGVSYDPLQEICNNGIDDNGNGLIDCEDPSCADSWHCLEKKEVPVVELFIMSHCAYGKQMLKGIVPVVELLENKIDFQLKFVDYSMAGAVEINEQLNMYCIDKEQNSKLLPYLRCFLTEGKGQECLISTNIDKELLDKCLEKTETEFGIKSSLADQSTWRGGRFPVFNIYTQDNLKYGVQGSPHLVINGVRPSTGRDSASLLNAICTAFKEKPSECDNILSSVTPSAAFGWT